MTRAASKKTLILSDWHSVYVYFYDEFTCLED